jgi:hypothetical protein
MSCIDCGRPTNRDSTALRCWKCKTRARQAACRRYYRKSHPAVKRCEGILCGNVTLPRRQWCDYCATAFLGGTYTQRRKASRAERAAVTSQSRPWRVRRAA